MYEENEESRKRNIERRRETSRFAARDRRGKEADIFESLKEVVPIVPDATVTHVDRIALLRVAATYCRLRKCAAQVLRTQLAAEPRQGPWNEDSVLECLDGFVMLLDSDGTILYVTESITLYLGLTQTDVTGKSLREFMHASDLDEFMKISCEMSGCKEDREVGDNVVLRMKTVISPRGRNLNLKGALYKPVSFLLRVMHSDGNAISILQGCTMPAGQGSVSATANAITKNGETPNGTFMTRHTCDMRISYVSETFNFMLKNDTRSLMGSSFYELVHPSDAHIVYKAIRELFAKGHVRTPFYRLVAANNNLAWVMTEATTINHTTRGQKGQYVICIHFVLGIQAEDESLIICTDTQPAGIPVLKAVKTEIDDNLGRDMIGRQPAVLECLDFTPLVPNADEIIPTLRGPRAPSPEPTSEGYDAVLQWLFRDHPSSPAPQYREKQCNGAAFSSRDDFLPPSSMHSVSSQSDAASGRTGGPGSVPFSPLAEGFAQCALRSPAGSLSPQNRAAAELPAAARTAGPSGVDAAPAHATRAVSAVHAAPAVALRAPGQARPVLAPVPASAATNVQFPATASKDFGCDSLTERAEAVNKALADLDFPFEDLHSVAPFVHQEELQPISDSVADDFQSLFPDLPDFTAAEPMLAAGRTAKPVDPENEENGEPVAKRPFVSAPPSATNFMMPPPQGNYMHGGQHPMYYNAAPVPPTPHFLPQPGHWPPQQSMHFNPQPNGVSMPAIWNGRPVPRI